MFYLVFVFSAGFYCFHCSYCMPVCHVLRVRFYNKKINKYLPSDNIMFRPGDRTPPHEVYESSQPREQ